MLSQDLVSSIFSDLSTEYEFNQVIDCAIRFFFRNPYESTIIVDKNARVQYMEKASERFLGLEPGGANGMDIAKLIPESAFPLTIKTGVPIVGRIFEVRGVKRIGAVYPLKIKGEIVGGVGKIMFHTFEEVERINNEIQKLKKEIRYFKQKEQSEYRSAYTFDNILGKSTLIKDAIDFAKKISLVDIDVLIYGESGTGKELFAHSIHGYANKDRPFVRVNCPAIPFDLAESEFFGYEKGAFSGALPSGKLGKFAIADNGTIFLDEISSLPLAIQAKLLRVLQEKEFERLGSTRTEKIKFRLISATNVDLQSMVKEGKFREDLYYRISKAVIQIPPLRERKEDIPLYLSHYLNKISRSFNMQIKGISEKIQDIFFHYTWPGNVRELINFLEQAALKAWNSEEILEEHLPAELKLFHNKLAEKTEPYNIPEKNNSKMFKTEIEEKEKEIIANAINETKGNKRKAAAILNMPRSTFYEKIKRYHIAPDN